MLEFDNVGVHKTDIDHNRTIARDNGWFAFVDPSVF